jgi:hypothetical protein
MNNNDTDVLAFESVRRWPSLSAKRWVISTLRTLSSHPDTAAILGIGSGVRRVHHRMSDIDFLVIADLEDEPASSPPIDVDLWVVQRSRVERKLRECDELLGGAIRFGRTIFERDKYWTNLQARWSDHLPFPSPKASDMLAIRFERFARQLFSVGDFDAALEQIIGMLTHRGRASLIRAGVYPASRPELPAQLRRISEFRLAEWLEQALRRRHILPEVIDHLKIGSAEISQI